MFGENQQTFFSPLYRRPNRTAIRHRSRPVDDDRSSVDDDRHRRPPYLLYGTKVRQIIIFT
jgi:hypothetical protein